MLSKIWVLNQKPDGSPTLNDFSLIEESLPPCEDGDFIIEAEFLSVDPYMRMRMKEAPINTPIIGNQVARVIESKNQDFPVGTYVTGYPGWRNRSHISKEKLNNFSEAFPFSKLPDVGNNPRSTVLGVLGMPGISAYFGFLEICQPKSGETVLVNGAAGSVGSLVCQIAKIKGCTVIAFAGSDTKVALVKEYGADFAYNYKTTNIYQAIKEAAPNGINCYFDNVGGEFTAEALPHMAEYGRIAMCGAISTYNTKTAAIAGSYPLTSPLNESCIITKQLKVQGFITRRQFMHRFQEGTDQLSKWIQEGKLKYRETVTDGFEKMPSAFLGLFTGENIGKTVVKA